MRPGTTIAILLFAVLGSLTTVALADVYVVDQQLPLMGQEEVDPVSDTIIWDILIPFSGFIGLIVLGLVCGKINENNHLKRLKQRESQSRDVLVTEIKSYPFHSSHPQAPPPAVYIGEVVIAADYLKTFLASLRNIFGGEVKSFTILLERARREAVLRIVEQARTAGYNAVCNVRFETTAIGLAGSVAVVAAGTAYYRNP